MQVEYNEFGSTSLPFAVSLDSSSTRPPHVHHSLLDPRNYRAATTPRKTASPAPTDTMTSNPAPANDAPLDDAAELPAGAALEAIDAAAVAMGIDAELPADAAPLDDDIIIIMDEEEAPPAIIDEVPLIIMDGDEAAMDDIIPAGPAEDAQAQTAAAEVCTASPV